MYGVLADMTERGVLGVPGMGSEKCSLNHLKRELTVSNT